MKPDLRDQLFTTLDKIAGTPILVVGDIILDRYVWGRVDRISPEAPVPIVEVKKTEDRLGGAANVVRNLSRLNAKPALCGFIGDDDEGQIILSLLAEVGSDRDGVLIDRSRPTTSSHSRRGIPPRRSLPPAQDCGQPGDPGRQTLALQPPSRERDRRRPQPLRRRD